MISCRFFLQTVVIALSLLIGAGGGAQTKAQPSMALYYIHGVTACDSTTLFVWTRGVKEGFKTFPEPIRNYVAHEGMFAITTSGNVYAWDVIGAFLLGDSTDYSWHKEVNMVSAIQGVRSVTGGDVFTLFLTDSGDVFGVGRNVNSRFLGYEADVEVFAPQRIDLPKKVREVQSRSQIVALMEDGTVWTWGVNSAGITGQDSDSAFMPPNELPEPRNVVAVSVANPLDYGGHVLALTADGSVWAWGQNDKGQIGNGTRQDQKKPVRIDGLTNVIAIATGSKFSIALRSDGSVWTWGDNIYGQLGTGDRTSSTVPVLVAGLTNIREVYAAGWNGIAIDRDGVWYGWGNNGNRIITGAPREHLLTPVQFPHPCSVSSVHEPEPFVALRTAPQPAQDVVTFTVALPEHSQISRLNIVDIRSNTVESITNIDGSATVDVTRLPAGVYVALAYDERGRLIVTQRFVVLH